MSKRRLTPAQRDALPIFIAWFGLLVFCLFILAVIG